MLALGLRLGRRRGGWYLIGDEMASQNPQVCPVCGVKILGGVVGGDRVLFSAGPPGTRARLWARVCRHVQKAGCINPQGGSQAPGADDFYKPEAPR